MGNQVNHAPPAAIRGALRIAKAASFGIPANHLRIAAAEGALNMMLAALDEAENFIAGFEDDDAQEGVPEMLARIRAAQRVAA